MSSTVRIHKRKTTPDFFEAVRAGIKNFEVRDIDPEVGPMKAGDILVLKEWNGEKYTGRSETRNVTYVLIGPYRNLIPEGVQVVGMSVPETITFIDGAKGSVRHTPAAAASDDEAGDA